MGRGAEPSNPSAPRPPFHPTWGWVREHGGSWRNVDQALSVPTRLAVVITVSEPTAEDSSVGPGLVGRCVPRTERALAPRCGATQPRLIEPGSFNHRSQSPSTITERSGAAVLALLAGSGLRESQGEPTWESFTSFGSGPGMYE